MCFRNNANRIVFKKHQISTDRYVLPCRNISSLIVPEACHGICTGVDWIFVQIRPCIMETEGYEHRRPFVVRCSVPCTVSCVSVPHFISACFEIPCAFSISHLCFGNPRQILSQISNIWIVFKHFLPIQHRFKIRSWIGIAGETVNMFLITTDDILRQTFFCMLMLYITATGVVHERNARHAQIPRNAGHNKER